MSKGKLLLIVVLSFAMSIVSLWADISPLCFISGWLFGTSFVMLLSEFRETKSIVEENKLIYDEFVRNLGKNNEL